MKQMKIYFAHSKRDYGSKYIKNTIKLLIDKFKEDDIESIIIDPSKIIVKENETGTTNFHLVMVKYFYPLIDLCDILVAIDDSRSCKFSSGVLAEIRYAESIGKKIMKIE